MRDESKFTTGSGTTTLVEDEVHPEHHDANRDPITGEPGSHPVGTGVGAAAGAAAGAAVGAAGGPVGALVGGTVGAIVGGLAGHGVAEQVNPTVEDAYWRENYQGRAYVEKGRPYEEYQPAYRYGWESRGKYAGRDWDDKLESDLERGWEKAKDKSRLTWHQAKHATRDAWDRVSGDTRYGTSGTTAPATGYGTPGYVAAFEAVDVYWKESWRDRPYAERNLAYEDYQPAFRYGWESRSRYPGRTWDTSLERDLESGWEKTKGTSRLTWERAKAAVRDAWDRFERALSGDADRDGR